MSEFHAGVFLIDKPVGPSSFTMVRHVRKMLGIKKVGHAGTLDPFASGLLIVCAGRPATKMISSFMDGDKEYLATVCLGRQTTTLDPEGEIVEEKPVGFLSAVDIENCLESFRGEQMQKPPAYSALKHKGKPLYYYARKGIEVEKEPRRVSIIELERVGDLNDLTGDYPELTLRVVCSKGTYIRTLGADIGDALGFGAYLTDLRRTRSGPFCIDKAVDGGQLTNPEEREMILEKMLSVEDVGNLLQ
jgi:tRNA pseudouridine55 synthase